MTELDRQIASDTALIALALIAVSFVLIGVVWKAFESRFRALEYEDRKELGKTLLVLLIPVVFLFAVSTFVGTKWPELLQPSGIVAMVLLLVALIIYTTASKIMEFFRKRRGELAIPRVDGNLLACTITLAILSLSILCSALALFGVIPIALAIKLPNTSSDDFYLSRWLLLDSTGFFLSGLLGIVSSIIPRKKHDD